MLPFPKLHYLNKCDTKTKYNILLPYLCFIIIVFYKDQIEYLLKKMKIAFRFHRLKLLLLDTSWKNFSIKLNSFTIYYFKSQLKAINNLLLHLSFLKSNKNQNTFH